MRRLLGIILMIVLVATFIFFYSEATYEKENLLEAKVIRVVDGDTFIAEIEGNKEKIRLLLIDTPETVHPKKPVQPFGPEASAFAKEKLENKIVRLELDVQERDKYGRILAYVYLNDGKMLNELLLAKGLARVVVYPPNVKYVEKFREIQKRAQEEKVGIWSKYSR
ncbi:hypothetical protein BHF71_02940 [Vulcanibacillus modesticaldus]|uniref:TNase-like domain-containing protein n=1 Tax=Vulcanibacillus modesticaldus TaxID=337097 RepID=A0A1D2YT86_9BACI|nr:thermonuclease family protein [Vulcanibacillus modesticaldus]OEF98899.1 hypothetical protein BHF71_02940 [Vulcanibacillus modesticaldus]